VTIASLLGVDIETFGRTDFYLTKFTQNLEPVWVRTAGSKQFDFGTVVRVAPNGDAIVSGIYQGVMNFEGQELPYSGRGDTFVARFDSAGNLLWVQTINGDEDVLADGMTLDSDGNIYLSGRLSHLAMFGSEEIGVRFQKRAFLTKLDPNGAFIYAKVVANTSSSGAVVVDYGHDGNLYVGGTFASQISGVFVASYSTSGTQNFLHTYEGGTVDEISDIRLGVDNHLYVCGRFSSATLDLNGVVLENPSDFFAGFVAKIKKSGEAVWAHVTGDRGIQLALGRSDTVFVTGYYTERTPMVADQTLEHGGGLDVFLTEIAADGSVQWVKNYSSTANDLARTMAIANDGSLLLAGEGSHDAFGVEPLGGTVFLAKTGQVGTVPEVPSETPALTLQWVDGALRLTLGEEFGGYTLEATSDLGAAFEAANQFLESVPDLPNSFKISLDSPARFFRVVEP